MTMEQTPKRHTTPCPTCGTECTISWSGLELVENTGDETLATKNYHPTSKDAEIKELVWALTLALPYVKGAYECAFPDGNENEYVESVVEQLLSKYK